MANSRFPEIVAKAHAAGMEAGKGSKPVPMIVTDTRSGHVYEPVMDGVCGFAWVSFAGNTEFGRWAKKSKIASKNYPKGLMVWVGEFNQSMTRKEAYAHAYANVLRAFGIEAYAQSRMD